MTERQQTRIILKEVFGTLAAIGAAGAAAAGIRGATTSKRLKSYGTANPPAKPAGLSGRVVQQMKNAFNAFGEKQQEHFISKIAGIDTEVHSRIAAKYNLKAADYAKATAEQTRKNDLIKMFNEPNTRTFLLRNNLARVDQNNNLTGLENIDIDDITSLKQAVSRNNPNAYVRSSRKNPTTVHDIISRPTTLEVLDTTNPEARQYREKMSRTMITPQGEQKRQQAIQSINTSRANRANMSLAIKADKAAEKTYLATERQNNRAIPGLKGRLKSALTIGKSALSALDPWNA